MTYPQHFDKLKFDILIIIVTPLLYLTFLIGRGKINEEDSYIQAR